MLRLHLTRAPAAAGWAGRPGARPAPHTRRALWRQGRYWRLVAHFALWGPLIGGLPYNLLIFPIPFSFAIGLGPALICGLLFSAWWHLPGQRLPNVGWRVLLGALCGTLACGLFSWGVVVATHVGGGAGPSDALTMLAFLALHGVPAASLLALREPGAAAVASTPLAHPEPFPAAGRLSPIRLRNP